METASFSLAFDGEGIRQGQIAAEDLGQVLTALHRLITSANLVLNGADSPLELSVKSEFENKCFKVNFDLNRFIDQASPLFRKVPPEVLLVSLGLVVGAGGLSLFQYLEKKEV